MENKQFKVLSLINHLATVRQVPVKEIRKLCKDSLPYKSLELILKKCREGQDVQLPMSLVKELDSILPELEQAARGESKLRIIESTGVVKSGTKTYELIPAPQLTHAFWGLIVGFPVAAIMEFFVWAETIVLRQTHAAYTQFFIVSGITLL